MDTIEGLGFSYRQHLKNGTNLRLILELRLYRMIAIIHLVLMLKANAMKVSVRKIISMIFKIPASVGQASNLNTLYINKGYFDIEVNL